MSGVLKAKMLDDTWVSTGAGSAPINAWPIGSVFIGVTPTNPAVLLGGGTWEEFAKGRMLVGLDPADASFDAAEETGGAKTLALAEANLPAHAHTINHTHAQATTAAGGAHEHEPDAGTGFWAYGGSMTSQIKGSVVTADALAAGSTAPAPAHTHTVNVPAFSGSSGTVGSGTPVDSLPPYIVTYMWKRTA